MKRRGTHATTGMVKQQEDKQKRWSEVVNFERMWWLKGKKMDRDSKERGGRGEAVKGLRRKGLDFFFFFLRMKESVSQGKMWLESQTTGPYSPGRHEI